jgi:hypothetical protein
MSRPWNVSSGRCPAHSSADEWTHVTVPCGGRGFVLTGQGGFRRCGDESEHEDADRPPDACVRVLVIPVGHEVKHCCAGQQNAQQKYAHAARDHPRPLPVSEEGGSQARTQRYVAREPWG